MDPDTPGRREIHERQTEIIRPVRVQEWDVVRDPPVAMSGGLPVVEEPDRVRTANKLIQIVYFIFGLIEGLIAIRFLLALLGANPANPFARLINGITWPFVFPFVDLVPTPTIGNLRIEVYSLFAIVIYVLLSYVLAKMIEIALK